MILRTDASHESPAPAVLAEEEGFQVVPLSQLHRHEIIQDEHLFKPPSSLGMGRCPGELSEGRLGEIAEETLERRGEMGLVSLMAQGDEGDDLGDCFRLYGHVTERNLDALPASGLLPARDGSEEKKQQQVCSHPRLSTTWTEGEMSARRFLHRLIHPI
jgi:hypothetical protein